VRKSYYVVSVVRLGDPSPRRQYWFDRLEGLRLSRQRSYDPAGRLVGDVRYRGLLPESLERPFRLPRSIHIERPYDDYALTITIRPDDVTLNRELPERAFQIEAPPEWGELRLIDLESRAR
jgi:hypothetical protein